MSDEEFRADLDRQTERLARLRTELDRAEKRNRKVGYLALVGLGVTTYGGHLGKCSALNDGIKCDCGKDDQ